MKIKPYLPLEIVITHYSLVNSVLRLFWFFTKFPLLHAFTHDCKTIVYHIHSVNREIVIKLFHFSACTLGFLHALHILIMVSERRDI
jgi:hypothetical protein